MRRGMLSFFILLLTVLFVSLQFHSSFSAKIELPLNVTDKQSSCSASNECRSGFVCLNFQSLACTPSDSFCTCLSSAIACTSETSCSSGYSCVHPNGKRCTLPNEICVCIADRVCVDAGLLSHLPMNKLVYKSHRRAGVLCDRDGSCATSGHMVVYEGQAMMMSSYCNLVGDCTKRVMHVNSPTMSRKFRITTKTDNLQFTALASRYESAVEERFLSTLLHMSI